MNEERAREILQVEEWLKPSGRLRCNVPYIDEFGDVVTLDGDFTADQLEAIAFWMRRG